MTRSLISAIVVLCVVRTALPAAAAQQGQRPINSYIVQVAEGFDPAQVGRGIARRTEGGLGHVYTRATRGFSIQLPPGLARQAIEGEPGVLKVEEDVRIYAVAQTLPTGVNRIDADQNAWARIDGVDERVNVDIAILDTGIDIDHPDLNVVGGTHYYTVLLFGFFPVGYQDNNYDDDNGHGTHCGGIAAALDNDNGVVGVAPGARLWAVKILDANGSGYVSDLIAGIDWVAANPSIKVASMSLAAVGRVDQLRTAIQNCVADGVIFVAAAGNEARDIFGADGVFPSSDDTIPAAYPEVAAISALADSDGLPGGTGGATTYGPDDSFAGFSNYSRTVAAGNPVNSSGLGIDLLMPGVSIQSCWLGGGYRSASGTSMATPHAAGLAALHVAAHGAATSAGGVYVIRQALIDGGKDQASGLRLAVPTSEPDTAPENLGWAGPTQVDPVTDVAIASISAPASAVQGAEVSIDVVVRNAGNQSVNAGFDVTLRDDTGGVDIGTLPTVTTLAPGASETLTFLWATSETTAEGEHTLTASHNLGDDNSGNDSASTSVEIVTALLDIAIASVEGPATAATGSSVEILVTVSNPGNQDVTETITVTLTDTTDSREIGAQTIGGLAAGDSRTLTFSWDTTGASVVAHTLTAGHDVEDDNATNDAGSTTVTITEQSAGPVVQVTTSVGPWFTLRHNRWKAQATVIVQDAQGWPVLYTTITGRWSGKYEATVTGSTDNSGLELFVTKAITGPGTVTFTVTSILDSEGRECDLQGTLSDSYTQP